MKKKLMALSLVGVLILGGCGGNENKDSELDGGAHKNYGDVTGESYFRPDTADRNEYLKINQNRVILAKEEPLTAFSLKVDTSSFSNVKRYIENGITPPVDAVKTEEFINYFSYEGETAPTESPFSIYTEIGDSPFDSHKKLAFIRVKTEDIKTEELPDSNLTFLIDTSGSMDSFDKLPLLKSAFGLLVQSLDENDKVSIVTYAGSSEIILDSVSGSDKETIMNAIETLTASGSTAGADGITTAYKLAEKNFKKGGNNRIILATDGDFNVGLSSLEDLEELITKKRDSGVYFSGLGFGMDNLQDDIMETLAKNGNGNYSYIDSLSTAKKVLVDEMGGNLFTVAEDVKAQIEFNPEAVKSYRLIGYENRKMTNEEFEDDKKDAGEIGAGTDVAILVELELTGDKDDYFEVRIRYKDPGKSESKEIVEPIKAERLLSENTSDFKFASAVAMFGEILRDSAYINNANIDDVIKLAQNNLGQDRNGYRAQFLDELMKLKKIEE